MPAASFTVKPLAVRPVVGEESLSLIVPVASESNMLINVEDKLESTILKSSFDSILLSSVMLTMIFCESPSVVIAGNVSCPVGVTL